MYECKTSIPRNVLEIIECFGTIDGFTNKVLNLYSDGFFSFYEVQAFVKKFKKVSAPVNVSINICNKEYESLIATYGKKNKSYSIASLLTWFVECEKYVEYGFEVVRTLNASERKCMTDIKKCKDLISKIKEHTITDNANQIIKLLEAIESEVLNGKAQ